MGLDVEYTPFLPFWFKFLSLAPSDDWSKSRIPSRVNSLMAVNDFEPFDESFPPVLPSGATLLDLCSMVDMKFVLMFSFPPVVSVVFPVVAAPAPTAPVVWLYSLVLIVYATLM